MNRIAVSALAVALTLGLTAGCSADEKPAAATSLSELCIPWNDYLVNELHIDGVTGGTRDPRFKMQKGGTGHRTCIFKWASSWGMAASLIEDRDSNLPPAERERARTASANVWTGQGYKQVDGYGYPTWVLDRRPIAKEVSQVDVHVHVNDHIAGFNIRQPATAPMTDEQLANTIRFTIALAEKLTR
ncbi:hypothetical protein [Nocardia caishijiensis]|uniref:DUF3558 domain-containing protein n=1 Tax=Nocardia caishijiensis TaxID=184756 RepID=A0ABQ6YF06_9NOCA|nr:hypothetical protein [Nocardia caishijiensis]KAF0835767.1 hypothetical protein FNL39_11713 [Nocardia caishijiensis]